MKCFVDDKPVSAFFAVFSDLSGACLFYKCDTGEYRNPIEDYEVDDLNWFLDAGYLWFYDVDDSFAKQAEDMFKNDTGK
tara:strand:- start:949 stop:1185 length:237 start_codon:yes stop_codon:yes gene_type:complete